MPRTSSTPIAFPTSASAQDDAPKTPLRSRFPALPASFSRRKAAPSSPTVASFTGEDAYPTPPRDKSTRVGQARERLASLLNRPAPLGAEDRAAMSPATADLVDTLRAIRARSASNASVASVATVRANQPAMSGYRKRERSDSTSTISSVAVPSRKRERVESTSSVASTIHGADKENGAAAGTKTSKRVRLHSAGPSADVLSALAAVQVTQKVQRATDEADDEAEVADMLSIEDEEWGSPPKKTERAVRPLKSRAGVPAPLQRHDSTCARISPALARSSIRTPEPVDIPSIPSPPASPARPRTRVSLADELARIPSTPAPAPPAPHYALTLDLAHAAFWDVDVGSDAPLAVHGHVRLLLSPPCSTPPDVAVEASCTAAPVQRGLGRAARAPEREPRVDVVVTLAWTKIRGVWTAPLELRVPPALFAGAETRTLALALAADVLLPRGAGALQLAATAELSVSALSTPRELALSAAGRVQLEAVARERAAQRALDTDCARERLLALEFEDMTPAERRQYKRWLDAQEDVF